jgi:hypothetical protein
MRFWLQAFYKIPLRCPRGIYSNVTLPLPLPFAAFHTTRARGNLLPYTCASTESTLHPSLVPLCNVCASTVSTLPSSRIFHHYGVSPQCLCKYCVNLALITYISSLWCLSAMFVQVLYQPCTHHVYFIIMVPLCDVCASTVSTLNSSRIFHHYGVSLRCLCALVTKCPP